MPAGRRCRPGPSGRHRPIPCSMGPIGIFIVRQKRNPARISITKNRTLGVLFSIVRCCATSIVAAVEAVIMVVVVMPVSARHNDDAGRILIISTAILAVVVMMVVVMMVIELG